MKPLHKVLMVGTTFVLAAATGHVMQNSANSGLQEAQAPQVTREHSSPALDALHSEAPAQATTAPDLAVPPMMRTPLFETDLAAALPTDALDIGGFAKPACAAPQIALAPAPLASVQMTVTAPCLAGQEAKITHAGLTFPIFLSPEGEWTGILPAMSTKPQFSFDFGGGEITSLVAEISGLENVNRIALSAPAQAGVSLHGLEYGAGYDGAGDVSALAPRTADTPLGGWMAVFGDAETTVQIYSAPANMSDIRLEMLAEAVPETCGQDVHAQAIRLLRGVAEAPAPITVAMPGCDDAFGAVVMPLPDFPLSLASAR
ncbi:hypothetical protein SAMN05877809_11096 [Rhodobacter sp. JA431]|uniref:hypothetical protein n=1 Tax=Rhodobacter sp. JA431 TaxID=570013 RepID=UPI000BC3B52F|nr:hypothetical protein [Rhodobacter sp. JA431]SOC19087.1 hypothetical protein SAMN05877809_11096 [Rhodobacter sp. JA431]